MKKSTLSILTIAVVLVPLTALAQKIQSKNNISNSTDGIALDHFPQQINHNAYGVPLADYVPMVVPDTNKPSQKKTKSLNLEVKIEPLTADF